MRLQRTLAVLIRALAVRCGADLGAVAACLRVLGRFCAPFEVDLGQDTDGCRIVIKLELWRLPQRRTATKQGSEA